MSVALVLDGRAVTIEQAGPTDSLLDWLRLRMGRTGTKEGCAEGDCGACTVLVGTLEDDGLVWRAVNACIQFLPMLHGKAVMTVESLGGPRAPTALQVAMAGNGASQCGFCTPGFVMSLHGRCMGARGADLPLADALAGNLCRCTGYGPILAAGEAAAPVQRDDSGLVAQLRGIAGGLMPQGAGPGGQWFAPRTVQELADLLARHPQARIVAGATDVGLWITKALRDLPVAIFIGDIAELATIAEDADGLTLGACVRYADAHAPLARLHPDMGELVRRIAGLQVRNAATIGGNIANGSPIGDGPPALIALGARLTLRSLAGRRTIPLEDYFLDYGRQDRQAGECVESIYVPRPASGDIVHVSKLSRRFDSDISAVCGAFCLHMAGDVIASARVAFGGMAATPRRAPACEAALTGRRFEAGTIAAAAAALAQDYAPLSDLRGSAQYRRQVAANLLWRLWHRAQGHATSVQEVPHV